MKLRHALPLALIALTAFGGCRPKRRPVTTPPGDTTGVVIDNGGGDADSIRMANEAAERERERLRAEQERLDRERLERETAGAREALTDIVFFDYDSDEIAASEEEKLRLKALVMQANPGLRLRIEGHADQRGSTEYNLALGQRRAEAVRAFLANYGVDPDRFSTSSFGKERPLVEGEDEGAWARNRRAEFVITGGEVRVVPQELRP
ncbi:MAG TPA: OmpA family protein [Longimicrobium sp.]|nr:OmpA family protein [Longimicrobium sp.]